MNPGHKPGFLFFFDAVKDYYQILGVRRGASTAEIRRAYRMLAQKLHPDVNPDPTAHELIKEVNEAYEVLGDETRRSDYDYRLNNPYTAILNVPEEPIHRDPYKNRARPYVHVSRKPSQYDLMNNYVHFADKTFWAGLFICSLLLIDFWLPHHVVKDTVSSFYNEGSGRYRAEYLVTDRGERIKIGYGDSFEPGLPIEIVKSKIFSILIEIRIPVINDVYTNFSTVFANFRFTLWILGIFSIVGIIFRKKGSVDFRFNLGVLTFFILMFDVYLLLK